MTRYRRKTDMALSRKKEESESVDIFQLQATAGVLAKYADRVFESALSISQSQLAVLLIIDSLKPPVNQSRVAERIQRGLNSTSMMIDLLEKLGMVTRTRADSDRRENYLELTPVGREKVAKGKKVKTLIGQRLARVLIDKDVRNLSNILNKLEEQAMRGICATIENGGAVFSLWQEYETGETREAQFVRRLDKLEMMFQAHEYGKNQSEVDLSEFWDGMEGYNFSELQEIYNNLKQSRQ